MIDYFLRSNNLKKISTKDLPMVCFVVTQHSESALLLCLRYSKTSCRKATKKTSVSQNCQLSTVTLVTQKNRFWKLLSVICYL